MSGFKFSECKRNQVNSVRQFRLEKSTFYGEVNGIYCGTILTMAKTVSYLDRVGFTLNFHVTEQHIAQCQNHTMLTEFTDICPGVILYTDASIVTITQSLFSGSLWKVLHSEHSSEISIMSSTFTNFNNYGSILYITSRSTINLYACRFKQCRGSIVLEAVDAFVKITHISFLNTLSLYI